MKNVLSHIKEDRDELYPKVLNGSPKPKVWGSPPPPNGGKCYRILLAKILVRANAEKKCWTGFEQSMSMTTTLDTDSCSQLMDFIYMVGLIKHIVKIFLKRSGRFLGTMIGVYFMVPGLKLTTMVIRIDQVSYGT